MVSQEICLEFVRQNPNCTTTDIVNWLAPKEWDERTVRSNCYDKCKQLEKYRLIKKTRKGRNVTWRAI